MRAFRRLPGNPDAYDCYLRGMACLSPFTAENLEQALALFTKATALDPDYASAYGMAMFCHANRLGYGVADVTHERSEVSRLLQMVMRIGQEDGVALEKAAWAVAYVLRDLSSAKQLIDRALALNPNLASAWTSSGWINVWGGRPDIAMDHLARARRLDPNSLPRPEHFRQWRTLAFSWTGMRRRWLWPNKWSSIVRTRIPACGSEPPVPRLLATTIQHDDLLRACGSSIQQSSFPASAHIWGPIGKKPSWRSTRKACVLPASPNNPPTRPSGARSRCVGTRPKPAAGGSGISASLPVPVRGAD